MKEDGSKKPIRNCATICDPKSARRYTPKTDPLEWRSTFEFNQASITVKQPAIVIPFPTLKTPQRYGSTKIGCKMHPIAPTAANTVKVRICPTFPIRIVIQQPKRKPTKCADPKKPISKFEKEASSPARASNGAIAPFPSCKKTVETIKAEKDKSSPNVFTVARKPVLSQ